ncbi:hypothetical protein DNL40_12305 [Xylanimonas oleitrophica]|uniref:CueP family metal-binding protein n=1 Tax=Xylanimonas oleitrophica TaxID=2607479 RepID=A0A2W5WML9_9MICO|nr:CueP family metal-binding protein [Xylanimonas oleitrophica]PZR52440.1 hypothetical protein DNL40_12305 [Xylanimonas oleitrophica]
MRRLAPGASIAIVLLLAGCASHEAPAADAADDQQATVASEILVDHGLSGLDGREMIDRLDRVPVDDRDPGLMASVRADELQLTDEEGRSTTLPLVGDEFYLSVAPYVSATHDCYYHSLTTCRGELGGKDVELTVASADGEVLVERTGRTFDNGFLGLWLPRDIDATLTVTYDDKTATGPISTRADDPTCLTTMRLT